MTAARSFLRSGGMLFLAGVVLFLSLRVQLVVVHSNFNCSSPRIDFEVCLLLRNLSCNFVVVSWGSGLRD